MTFQWGNLLIKRDSSGKKHIYGSFTTSKDWDKNLCAEAYAIYYIFYGREGCPIHIQRFYGSFVSSRLSARINDKKQEGYIEITPSQLNSKWGDLREQCDQYLLMEILQGK